MTLPVLIVVSGPPGAGKTTLAHRLARDVGCPAICRDELREGMMNTLRGKATPSDDIARRVYDVFFDVIDRLLAQKVTLVAEAAFRYPLWARGLGPLLARAEMRVVQCRVTLDTLRERCIERTALEPNRRFHPDGAFLAQLEQGGVVLSDWDMDALGRPSLTVDSSEGYQPKLEEITRFARWHDGMS